MVYKCVVINKMLQLNLCVRIPWRVVRNSEGYVGDMKCQKKAKIFKGRLEQERGRAETVKPNKLSIVFVCRGLCLFSLTTQSLFCTLQSLQKGDIITVLKRHDNGKWFGQLGDRTGYFQFNYVESIPQSENPDWKELAPQLNVTTVEN